MDLILKWINVNTSPVTVKIYRGTSPLDRANLSGPLVTLTNGETEWLDNTAVRGITYYYVFETTSATDRVVSQNHKIKAGSRRGPGPSDLLFGDYEYGYFGELLSVEFLSTSELRGQLGFTGGNVTQASPIWHKYARKGKILLVPNGALASAIAYNTIYAAGLVFGVDGPGVGGFIPTPNVNQKKTVKVGPDTFLVRLMTGYSDNVADVPATNESTSEPNDALSCEWEDLIYPLYQYTPDKQRMVNVANYTAAQLRLTTQYATHCQERASGTLNIVRGANSTARSGVSRRGIGSSSASSADNSWWPVLELIETAS